MTEHMVMAFQQLRPLGLKLFGHPGNLDQMDGHGRGELDLR
jgi:hypothetical protein